MPTLTPADIAKLCENWCTAVKGPDGGFRIGGDSEKHRLRANGVVFHELSYQSLAAAVLGTSKVLLLPGLNVVIDYDHFWLWAWLGELILSPQSSLFAREQYETALLLRTTLHAALANSQKPVSSKEEWREQRRIWDLQPHNAKQLLGEAGLLMTHLALPLLEALLKRACSKYVMSDGTVIARFSVPNKRGVPRIYDPRLRGRDQCSSVRDLLFLHLNLVANAELKGWLDQFRHQLGIIDNKEDPFDLIYSWRNQSLHGSATLQTIGATILSLCLLILLSELKQNFEQLHSDVSKAFAFNAKLGHTPPASFYPPY